MKIGKSFLGKPFWVNLMVLTMLGQITLSSFGEAVAQSTSFVKSTADDGGTNYSVSILGHVPTSAIGVNHNVKYPQTGEAEILNRLYKAPNWITYESEFQKELQKSQGLALPTRGRGAVRSFLTEHMKFCAAMAVNQLFFVATSGDRKMFDEWKNSMTSLEFHTSMLAFTMTMGAYNKTLDWLFNSTPATSDIKILNALRHLSLPLGNYVSKVFSDAYNNPIFQEWIATWDPHHQVEDPDNKGAGKTQDREVRNKVRHNLQLKLLRSLWENFTNGENQFNYIFASAQLGVVAYAAGKVKGPLLRVSAKLGGGTKRYFVTFVNKTASGVELTLEKFLPTEIVDSLVGGAEVAYLEGSGLLERFFMGAGNTLIRTGAAEFIGGVSGLVYFFIINGVFTYIVEPVRLSNQRIRSVDQSVNQLSTAINWYLNRKPGEEIPWGLMDASSRKWSWIKFFLSADANKLQSDESFYQKFWDTIKPIPRISGQSLNHGGDPARQAEYDIWGDGEESIRWFTEKFFGTFLNETDFHKCGQDKSCQRDWMFAHAPDFQKNLTQFKGEMYLRAGVQQVSENFSKYRKEVIFQDATKKQEEWSAKINDELAEMDNKEAYFLWIARGMNFNDRYFLKNDGFWHIDLDGGSNFMGTNYFIEEQVDRVAQFDHEVLKCSFLDPQNWCYQEAKLHPEQYVEALPLQSGERGDMIPSQNHEYRSILTNHQGAFKKFLSVHRAEVNAHSLESLIRAKYPTAYAPDPTPRDIEFDRVKALVLSDPFSDQRSTADKQEEGVLVRWLLQGMPSSAEYSARAGRAWPIPYGKELFGREAMCTHFVEPFLSLRLVPQTDQGEPVPCISPFDLSTEATDVNLRDYHQEMAEKTGELMGLLYGGSAQNLKDSTRDLIIAAKYSFDETNRQREVLEKTISDLNAEFSEVLAGEIYPGKGYNQEYFAKKTNEFLQKFAGPKAKLFSEDEDIFTRGGEDKARTWHFLQSIGDLFSSDKGNTDGKYLNVPRGALNNYDYEMKIYSVFINDNIARAKIDNDVKKFGAQGPDVIQSTIADTALLSMIWPQTQQAREVFKVTDQKVFKNLSEVELLAGLISKSAIKTGAICESSMMKAAYDGAIKDCQQDSNESRFQKLGDLGGSFVQSDNLIKKTVLTEWPDVRARLNQLNLQKTKDEGAREKIAIDEISRLRMASLATLKADVQSFLDKMKRHETAPSSMKDDTLVPAELKTNNFLAPLMTATTGPRDASLSIIEILGEQVVQTENQKLIEARTGCFMLGDKICSPFK